MKSWRPVLYSCGVALAFSFILLALFRYAIKNVIWIILIGVIVSLTIGAIVTIYLYVSGEPKEAQINSLYPIFCGVMTFLALIYSVLVWFFRKRVQLLIELLKETPKALTAVPLLLIEPFFSVSAIGFICLCFMLLATKIEFTDDYRNICAHVLNLIAFAWLTSIVNGCHSLVIAGTVSKWFFACHKSKLEAPISKSFFNLLRFHVGTVCLGSMLLSTTRVFRILINILVSYRDYK